MKTHHLPAFLLLLCAAVSLTACEDATNVGESLVGAQGGNPVTEEFAIDGLSTADLERPNNLAPRALAGRVEDPALGTYTVHGYVDLTPITSSEFRAHPVDRAELRLTPTYVYGDTTAEVTMALRGITEEWENVALPTDTSFSVGPVVREFTFDPTDTLVVVPLPTDWVEEHDDILRSTDFGDLFHGFRFDPVSGNTVVGFGPGGSSLFAASAEDSVSSPFGKSYSSVERTMPVELPPDRILMQAGTGPIVSFRLFDDVPELPASSINRAAVSLWADTSLVTENTPPNFVRPLLETIDLYGVTEDGAGVLVARATLDEDAQYVFEAGSLARSVQNAILDGPTFDHFEVRIPNPTTLQIPQGPQYYYYTSINPIIFYDAGAGDKSPQGYLTLTPLD